MNHGRKAKLKVIEEDFRAVFVAVFILVCLILLAEIAF